MLTKSQSATSRQSYFSYFEHPFCSVYNLQNTDLVNIWRCSGVEFISPSHCIIKLHFCLSATWFRSPENHQKTSRPSMPILFQEEKQRQQFLAICLIQKIAPFVLPSNALAFLLPAPSWEDSSTEPLREGFKSGNHGNLFLSQFWQNFS